MADFRRGAEAAKAAATRTGGGKFTPSFTWEPGETKYIQFLTSLDEMATVLMHRFIIVGQREDGNPIYESFISRRDANLDGPDGYDPLIDRFGLKPTERNVLIGVELIPEYQTVSGRKKIAGFDVALRQFKRDEKTVEVPNVALVIESPHIFTNQLITVADMAQDNIEDRVYAIQRNGKGTDTSYTFLAVEDALEFDEDEFEDFFSEFDFDQYLNDLADEEKIRTFIDPLPDNAVVSKYPGKGKPKAEKEEKPKTSTRTRRTKTEDPVAEEAEPEEAEVEAEEGADEPAAPAGRRTRKFSDLKKTSAR